MERTKVCAACGERKPASAFRARANSPDGLYYQCRECVSIADRRYREQNKERVAAIKKRWSQKNPEFAAEAVRRWRERGGRRRESVKGLRERSPEAYAKLLAKWAKRDADRIRATPAWFDPIKVDRIYLQAALMRSAGHDVHVDHIVPLRGKTVCGLHVHNNLRIIPAKDNLAKGAKLLHHVALDAEAALAI